MELSEQIVRQQRRCEQFDNQYVDKAYLREELSILASLRKLQAIEEASEMPEKPTTIYSGSGGEYKPDLRDAYIDALRLHAQHLASKELK